ncbi:anti-repressor SinI family protein [Virgibacillus siamensis]|uniref:anti-repressor SinI family protein n=1 Tax=Virgibacillus siamensis TaxID=480071 RepID=UPI0011154DA4|nr:anti-repressor SinI family protein [Virgibacillus siamensis]
MEWHGKLDDEWIILIKAAREMGLSVDEIRKFLQGDTQLEKMAKPCHPNHG